MQSLGVSAVPTNESTTSTTPDPLITLERLDFSLAADGRVLLEWAGETYNEGSLPASNAAGIYLDGNPVDGGASAVTTTGANVLSSQTAQALVFPAAGSHTVEMRYSVSRGTGHWLNRLLKVTLLP